MINKNKLIEWLQSIDAEDVYIDEGPYGYELLARDAANREDGESGACITVAGPPYCKRCDQIILDEKLGVTDFGLLFEHLGECPPEDEEGDDDD
jgi:hypothetical protein